jgi:hypothetical protein
MNDVPIVYCAKPVACVCGTGGTRCYKTSGHIDACRAWCCDDPYTNPAPPSATHAEPIRIDHPKEPKGGFPWIKFRRGT